MNVLRCIVVLLAGASACCAVTIDTDTVIGPGSLYDGEEITVVDGIGGSTLVDLVDGGSVAGFFVDDSSVITINGGESTYISSLSGDAGMRLVDGRIACLDFECGITTYDALLTANDRSTVEIRGGSVQGRIRLHDQSRLFVFGDDLTLNTSSGINWYIRGALSDGTVLDGDLRDGGIATIDIILDDDPSGRIFLVPEPSTVCLLVAAFVAARLQPASA